MPRVVRRSQLIKRRVRHRRHKFRQLFTLSFANPYHSEPTHRVRRHRPRLPCATEPSLHRGGTHAKSLGRRSNRKPFILHNFDHPLTHLDRQRLWHRDPLDTVRSHLDLRRNSKGAISDQPAREPLYTWAPMQVEYSTDIMCIRCTDPIWSHERHAERVHAWTRGAQLGAGFCAGGSIVGTVSGPSSAASCAGSSLALVVAHRCGASSR